MARNDYRFVTRWRVESTVQKVSDVLGDTSGLARWWPSVYLAVSELEPGDAQGVGKVVNLYTKGWLPYTLRWQFRVTESGAPCGFALEARGDFAGRGVWTFEQMEDWVNITYDWAIRADKPLLKQLSFLLKPLFSANHRWAMQKGEESLRLELLRRQTASELERARVPPPPPPTPSRVGPWLGYLVAHLFSFPPRAKAQAWPSAREGGKP